jgi:drug/metabolite transporter (DMT)-like permease
MILALLSGIVWSIYAVLEKKANKDIMILTFIGIIILIFLALKIKIIDEKENELLKQLEKEN